MIQETEGTVELKIARLERHLQRLEQQQALSNAYPDYKAKLMHQKLQVQLQILQLTQLQAVVFAA